MQRFVSQECLDCVLMDIRETTFGEPVSIHPLVLRRMIEELVLHRAGEFLHDDESIAA